MTLVLRCVLGLDLTSWMRAVELSTCFLQVTLVLRCVLGLDLTSWMGAVELSTYCLQVTLVLRCVSSLLSCCFFPQVGHGVVLLGIFFLNVFWDR